LPLSYDEHQDLVLEEVKELAAKGWTQKAIAERVGYSQQHVSRLISQLRDASRAALRQHYQRLAYEYELVLHNLYLVRKDCWSTLAVTKDARTKSVLYNNLLSCNRELLEVLAAGDLIQEEILNAEVLATQAKAEIRSVRRSLEDLRMGESSSGSGSSGDDGSSIQGLAFHMPLSEDTVSTHVEPSSSSSDGSSSDSSTNGSTYDVVHDSTNTMDSTTSTTIDSTTTSTIPTTTYDHYDNRDSELETLNRKYFSDFSKGLDDDLTNAPSRKTTDGDGKESLIDDKVGDP
jgi:transcriptional regulator with XRE-family HTH domain